MGASEQKEQVPRSPGVTINVNSPNNCIVSGDRIEISIQMGQPCESRAGQLVRFEGHGPEASKQ
jgi:hypothetical protein